MGGWNDKELGRQYEKVSADHAKEMAKRIAAELRIAELEAALGSLWDAAVTTYSDGDLGCFVKEAEWRKAMSAHSNLSQR